MQRPDWERAACLLELYKTRVVKGAGETLRTFGRLAVFIVFGVIGVYAFSKGAPPPSLTHKLQDGVSNAARKFKADFKSLAPSVATSDRINSGIGTLKGLVDSVLVKARSFLG